LLSHDLIEGAHAGVALASDIELFETLPLDYASYSQRQHRWTRGDWQIARWALPHVPSADGRIIANPLNTINRWRIFDNLRRSLVPLASLLLLLAGVKIATSRGVWTLVVGLAVAIPAIVPVLDRVGRRFERDLARKTWRFFDDLIGPATHWLPSDNVQLALRVEVADRTSPTNIGLGLASTLAAFDLGYLTVDGLADRCSQTIMTIERLERYEGHLLNWYDTQTLGPLATFPLKIPCLSSVLS
jgi:hypothetical protein